MKCCDTWWWRREKSTGRGCAADAQGTRRAHTGHLCSPPPRAAQAHSPCWPRAAVPELGHRPRHRWPRRGSGKGGICVLESFVVEMAGTISSAAPQPCSPAWAAASRAATSCSHPLFSPSSFIKMFRPKCPGSVSFLSYLRTWKEERNLLTAQPGPPGRKLPRWLQPSSFTGVNGIIIQGAGRPCATSTLHPPL